MSWPTTRPPDSAVAMARSTPASREIGRYIADALVERIDAILSREFGATEPAAGSATHQ